MSEANLGSLEEAVPRASDFERHGSSDARTRWLRDRLEQRFDQTPLGEDRGFRLRAILRRLNRFRWVSKWRNVSQYPRASGTRMDRLRYVLASPEVSDYSLDVSREDLDAAVQGLATAYSVDRRLVASYVDEALGDEVLRRDYAHGRRWALLPRTMMVGQRALWYAIVRIRKPRLVVETGVWYGLGSMVLLRALERNEHESGSVGRLVSFEPDPTSGWLVPDRHRDRRWVWLREYTNVTLAQRLSSTEAVDLFIHDTPSGDGALERRELAQVWPFLAPAATVVSGNGTNTPALQELCDRESLPFSNLPLRPDRHWYVGNGMSMTITDGTDGDAVR